MDNLFLSNNERKEKQEKDKKKKFNQYKDEAIKSLYEVENFLSKTKSTLNKIKIVKLIK